MKEFPKMLYKTHSDHITVDTGKEEASARADGYVDYSDLSDGGVFSKGSVTGGQAIDPDSYVPVEQFDALGLRIGELESANHMLTTENAALTAQVADYETRLQEANQHATDNAQANTDPAGANTGKAGATTKVNK